MATQRDSIERLAIFVDVENLRFGMKDNLGRGRRNDPDSFWGLDFHHFFRPIINRRRVVCVRYYDAVPRGNDKEAKATRRRKERLHNELRSDTSLSGQVRSGTVPAARDQRRPQQKGVDVMLATDLLMLGLANFYDTAAVVSNDSDYVDAFKYAMDVMSKRVEAVLLLRRHMGRLVPRAYELKDVASYAWEIKPSFLRRCYNLALYVERYGEKETGEPRNGLAYDERTRRENAQG